MGKKATCTTCRDALKRLGAACSVACRWLWGLGQAIDDLDDEREAREIEEARRTLQHLIACAEAASRHAPAQLRAECLAAASRARKELHDVRRYDAYENEAHAQIAHCSGRARASLAPLSRAGEATRLATARRNGGAAGRPVWALMETQMRTQMVEAE